MTLSTACVRRLLKHKRKYGQKDWFIIWTASHCTQLPANQEQQSSSSPLELQEHYTAKEHNIVSVTMVMMIMTYNYLA